MCAGGIARASVVVLAIGIGAGLFEGSGTIDGEARGAVLVLAVGVDKFCGEGITAAAVGRAGGSWRRRKVVSVEVDFREGLFGYRTRARARGCWARHFRSSLGVKEGEGLPVILN